MKKAPFKRRAQTVNFTDEKTFSQNYTVHLEEMQMTLKEKLLRVMSSVTALSKKAKNETENYAYVEAAEYNAAVGAALRENRIICIPKTRVIVSRECAEGTMASVEVEITLIDVDSDETFLIIGAGDGKGKNAMGTAQTMAMKYAWKMAFVVAEKSDDPNADPEDTNKNQSNKSTAPSVATTKKSNWIK